MVEADTVSEAASTTENGTGPPESTGENAFVVEEKDGVVEDENEAKEELKDEAMKMEEVNEGEGERGEETKGEEEGDAKVEEEGGALAVEGEQSVDGVNKEAGDAKRRGEGERSKEDEMKDDAGSSNMEEEGDVEEVEEHGEIEKNAEGRVEGMEEESDMKEEVQDGVEKKHKESEEENGSKKRQRGQRARKRKKANVVRGTAKETEAASNDRRKHRQVDEKGSVKKKNVNVSDEQEEKKEEKKKNTDGEKGSAKKAVNESKAKESSTPITFSLDRPVRERKSVERLVVALENETVKDIFIPKGRGTPLKDIPNVAYKLSKKKSDDTTKLLHAVIFGRRGKASQIKNNVSQFSGFVWHENEGKQQAKIKERLDKYVKNKLMEFCDLLDIPFSKATVRKEDLVSKLLDFLMAPHATTDVVLAEKDQPNKANKRKRTVSIIASPKSGSTTAKRSARKRRKIGDTPKVRSGAGTDEDEQVEEDKNVNDTQADEKEQSEPSESSGEDKPKKKSIEDSGKGKNNSKKSSKSSDGDVNVKKMRTPKKAPKASPKESSMETSKQSKSKVDNISDTIPRVFSRKKKNDETPKKKPSTLSKSIPKDKTGKVEEKKALKPKKKESGPSTEDLRETIGEILKEVDFNTATFTDILKQLGRHFKTDLTPRKSSIKLMIHEELSKLAEEEDDEDDDSSGEEGLREPAGEVGA